MKPRIEQKLRLDRRDYVGFLRWLQQQGAVLLHPDRFVHSTYFDTPRLQMLRDTDEGIVPRKKIRVRCYGNHSATCSSRHQLEVKQTTEQQRLKETRDCPDWQSLESTGIFDPDYGHCRPTVSVEYQRSYYQVHRVRVTIDRYLRYRAAAPLKIVRSAVADSNIAIELKAPAGTDLDRLANAFPFPTAHFSKYERAAQSIYPWGG